jgi:hypothetical protein
MDRSGNNPFINMFLKYQKIAQRSRLPGNSNLKREKSNMGGIFSEMVL